MLGWVAASGLICAIFGAFGTDSIVPLAADVQSYLLLGMALAATVLLGAFDAYEGRGAVAESSDED
ncbi:MAG TPA: hypothetical protein VMU56_01575 [Beijerinckiaceae bacterium]|nr:hypothetical protein [Beijerinckiaceae bacterium]HVB89193.1 hypothetical protein [Beijerinckiaceae bacterium]